MKRIFIGSLVATVIYFVFQTIMWVGGFHKDFNTYSAKQDTILKVLNENLEKDGMYMMPMADANSPDFKAQQENLEKQMVGRPWAMIFFHRAMSDFTPSYIVMGILYTLIACMMAALVVYHGNFHSFLSRFMVAMTFAIFTLAQGIFDDMNWWSFPWSWVKPQVFDLLVGWGICSLWLAFFVKRIAPEKEG
jgi:hypothetical protein